MCGIAYDRTELTTVGSLLTTFSIRVVVYLSIFAGIEIVNNRRASDA